MNKDDFRIYANLKYLQFAAERKLKKPFVKVTPIRILKWSIPF
jgi:hypothetical protein